MTLSNTQKELINKYTEEDTESDSSVSVSVKLEDDLTDYLTKHFLDYIENTTTYPRESLYTFCSVLSDSGDLEKAIGSSLINDYLIQLIDAELSNKGVDNDENTADS